MVVSGGGRWLRFGESAFRWVRWGKSTRGEEGEGVGRTRGMDRGGARRSKAADDNRSPRKPENMVVKRIIALEGDTVATRDPYPFPTETVPLGHVWVEGEHPEGRMSLDSNTYGPVSGFLFGVGGRQGGRERETGRGGSGG